MVKSTLQVYFLQEFTKVISIYIQVRVCFYYYYYSHIRYKHKSETMVDAKCT